MTPTSTATSTVTPQEHNPPQKNKSLCPFVMDKKKTDVDLWEKTNGVKWLKTMRICSKKFWLKGKMSFNFGSFFFQLKTLVARRALQLLLHLKTLCCRRALHHCRSALHHPYFRKKRLLFFDGDKKNKIKKNGFVFRRHEQKQQNCRSLFFYFSMWVKRKAKADLYRKIGGIQFPMNKL